MRAVEKSARAVCQHHWIVPSSPAREVKAVCRKCGEEKEMQNQWGFHSGRREPEKDWQVEEHVTRVARKQEITGRGLAPL